MKAIIIVNVPDNTEFDKDYRLTGLLLANKYTENVAIEFKDARLKPVPSKKGKHGELNHYDTDIHYEIGWNDCIDEIIGEEE